MQTSSKMNEIKYSDMKINSFMYYKFNEIRQHLDDLERARVLLIILS